MFFIESENSGERGVEDSK